MYEIVAPNGKIHTPPPGNCWKVIESEFKKALADGRVTFGNDGNGVPRRKQFLSEAKGIVPWTWWPQDEVGHTGESKDEVNALFGSDISFDTPKPERLIERIIHIATNPGDLVLDSFLGSGTTAAVAQKMGRRWIGVEMGNHAYTHCKVRADKVIAGQDPGGITKAQNWQGGGGYRFYEVAPTLINKDAFDEYVINEDYLSWMNQALPEYLLHQIPYLLSKRIQNQLPNKRFPLQQFRQRTLLSSTSISTVHQQILMDSAKKLVNCFTSCLND